MLKENNALKLKDPFIILVNPRTNKEIIVLDTEKEKMILKLNVENILERYSLNFRGIGDHYTSMFTLSKTIEGQLLLKIFSLHPDMFEIKSFHDELVKKDYKDYEFSRTINHENLFATYSYEENQPNEMIILWGINDVSDLLIHYLYTLQMPTLLVEPTTAEKQDIQCIKFLSTKGYYDVNDYFDQMMSIYQVQSIGMEELKDLILSKKTIHIVDQRLLDYQLIDLSIYQELTSTEIILYYGFYVDQFIVGPLSIKNENYGYDAFKQVFSSKNSLPSIPQSLIVAGLLKRTLYFLMKKTLKYLAEDAQLPLNQVFSFDNYNFSSKIIDIEIENK